ncbi:MAG: amylo-alpha-1,6-glucosidase, partial [Myxococcota bacterium]
MKTAGLVVMCGCGFLLGACGDSGGKGDAMSDATSDTAVEDADATAPTDTAVEDSATDASDDSDASPDVDTTEDVDVPTDVVGPPPLEWSPYVRGTFNDWGTGSPMAYLGGGVYQVSVPISVGSHMFKIANEAWRLDTIYSTDGHSHVEIPLSTPMPLVSATGYDNDAVLNIPAEGQYTFKLTVTVSDATPSLVLEVIQGDLTPIEYPDDSAVETFAAIAWTAAPPVGKTVGGTPRTLDPQALFDAVAIDVPAGTQAQYLFGDNIDGYYEGWTHSYTTASRYRHHEGYLFTYAASLVGDDLLDASSEATGTTLYPYGVRTRYAGGRWEELVPASHARGLTLRVHSDTPGRLSIVPKLEMRRTSTDTWQRVNGAMVYALEPSQRHAGSPAFVAIAADRAHTVTGVDLEARPALASVVGITASSVKPIFTTSGDETDFRLCLAFGESAAIAAARAQTMAGEDTVGMAQQAVFDFLAKGYVWTDDQAYDRALAWARLSARMMVVEELGSGIWAGLPWFKNNWGRDTFISLPGALLVSGRFAEAKAVIQNFASLQEDDEASADYGRVPNVVNSLTDLNYNTTDGTPWLVREIEETVRATGDTAFGDAMYPVVDRYLTGAIAHHVDGDGLLTHGDTATWMDAAFTPTGGGDLLPWSARGNRAVEIQALWYVSLRIGAAMATARGETAKAATWSDLADQVKAHFAERFWDDGAKVMADRVRADDTRDVKVRPNQLMLLSIPFEDRLVPADVEAHVLRNAVTALLYPYGIASLDQTHAYFHPFHDHQTAYPKDAAYHNGTVWGWNAGFTVTALTRYGQVERAWALTQNLGEQILGLGTRGAMSELLDAHPKANGDLTPSGTFAQTWSVAEYARNALQDFVGFRPNVPAGALELSPSIPDAWQSFDAEAPFGDG